MYNIGIDLGGTNIKVGVVNDDFKIVGKSNIKTDLPRPAEEIADSIAKGVELACKEAGIDVKDINSIGIGTPGVADRNTGVVLYSCNLGFNNTDLGGLLKHRLGTDIYVENDANVAAYGEVLGGAAKAPEKQPQTSGFDIDSIMKIKNAYDKINSKPDPRVSLLTSLRPYMSPGRATQLDGIVRLLSLTRVSDLFKEMKGGL